MIRGAMASNLINFGPIGTNLLHKILPGSWRAVRPSKRDYLDTLKLPLSAIFVPVLYFLFGDQVQRKKTFKNTLSHS